MQVPELMCISQPDIFHPLRECGIEATGKADEYRMPISFVGVHTASFVLKEDMILGGTENVKMSSSTFNDYYAEVNIFQTHIFGSRISGYSDRPVLYSEILCYPGFIKRT